MVDIKGRELRVGDVIIFGSKFNKIGVIKRIPPKEENKEVVPAIGYHRRRRRVVMELSEPKLKGRYNVQTRIYEYVPIVGVSKTKHENMRCIQLPIDEVTYWHPWILASSEVRDPNVDELIRLLRNEYYKINAGLSN